MSGLFNCWRAFCETLEHAGNHTSAEIYEAWYAFFDEHPTFYL